MNNTRRVTYQNPFLAEEWHKHGRLLDNTEHTRGKQGFFMKKKSDETLIEEGRTRRYESRKNRCESCHMALPLGTGECDTCG